MKYEENLADQQLDTWIIVKIFKQNKHSYQIYWLV